MAVISWTSEAEGWLKEIFEYIKLDNPSAAVRVIEGIYERVQLLCQFPDIGYKYRSELEGEIRILLYGHYRIAYLKKTGTEQIDILDVFHGALDIDKYFS